MTTFTEGVHTSEFIIEWEDDSVDQVTVASGENLLAGSVIGQILRTLAAAPAPAVVGAGNGTMSNVRPMARAKVGNYVVTCTVAAANGGTFSVVDPDGNALPDLVLNAGAGATTNYASDQINFSVTDGANDFAVGDVFTIAVTAGAIPAAVGTGDGVLSALSLGPQAQNGSYLLECIVAAANGGTFSVTAPDGQRLDDLVMTAGAGATTDYVSDHLNFTIADGANDFVVGDKFTIPVVRPATYGEVVAYDPATYDGRHIAAGMMFGAVDATAAATNGTGLMRDCVVDSGLLDWGSNVTAAQKQSAYEDVLKRQIVVR